MHDLAALLCTSQTFTTTKQKFKLLKTEIDALRTAKNFSTAIRKKFIE